MIVDGLTICADYQAACMAMHRAIVAAGYDDPEKFGALVFETLPSPGGGKGMFAVPMRVGPVAIAQIYYGPPAARLLREAGEL